MSTMGRSSDRTTSSNLGLLKQQGRFSDRQTRVASRHHRRYLEVGGASLDEIGFFGGRLGDRVPLVKYDVTVVPPEEMTTS